MLNLKPLHPHEFLSWMAIPTYPGVYILGCFARHVTIYSQQMRAFNLVDALCKTGQLRPGASVAVVGGGIAGLTAAAAAAVRGAKVTIIESDHDFFPIQRHAGTRYLHPHIYDWPLYEKATGRENTADFPFLDWEANDAEAVFEKLKGKWDRLFKDAPSTLRKPKTLMKTRVTALVPRTDSGVVELTLETAEKDENDTPQSQTLEAEIVILAVGFGREFGTADLQRYWEQAPFDAVPVTKLRWLVSGYGDGGLTDLMRLCIDNFRHDEFVKKYEADPTLGATLRKLLEGNKKQSVREVFEELLDQLDPDSSNLKLRTNTEVVLNAPPNYLESEGSSILNKFVVFQLEKLGKFTIQDGWVKRPIPTPDPKDRKYTVEFVDKDDEVIKTEVFDRLIIRHGPERPISETNFPEIWKATEDLQKRWAAQSQSNDRTRVQMWDPADYKVSTAPNPIMLVEEQVEEQVDLHCIVVESTSLREQGALPGLVRTAVNSHKKDIGLAMKPPRSEGNIKPRFDTIKINEALNGQKEYNRAVNLVCKADVAVIDVTRYEPGVMVLLGIRSAVKRGVTIVTTNRKLDSTEWSNLPFNLKELYPLSLLSEISNINSPEHPIQVVGRTIARSLAHYNSLPFYQDVPAYEAVRRFDPALKDEAQHILWLCSFNPSYASYATYIQSGYLEAYGNERNERNEYKYLLERIIEIVSPQVVTQKLYSAIRRTPLCLVDWTFWSPNVFFELGVRLAVSNFGPICLLATDAPEFAVLKESNGTGKPIEITEELREQRAKLKKLFQPLEYDLETDKQELFQEIRYRHEAMQDYEAPGRGQSRIPPTFGAFPFDHTYKFVGGLLPLQNEPGAWNAHSFLSATADSLIGVSSTTDLVVPVLYANVNKELDQQARVAAKEALIAAWYYLGNRYRDEWKQSKALQEEYRDLSIRLSDLLRASNDPKDQALNKSVKQEIRSLNKLIGGADQ